MLRIYVAFIDGTFTEDDYPDHELDDIKEMIERTPKDLISRVEIEDRKQTIIYSYKRKLDCGY